MSLAFEHAIAVWRSTRAEYQSYLEVAYLRAEAATRGHLLNRRGYAAEIDPMTLFLGNEVRAHAYASEELIEHWRRYPRMTFAAFERQWLQEEEAS